jgi:NAD(P)-dependent dehydrogenase (short-subunit alcohol dehydrogenase family)
MSLDQHVAVITGAAGGLASFVAGELASRGVRLALLGRDQARLDALAQALGLGAEHLMTRSVNLLHPTEVQTAADAVAAKFGKVDILVHLVGGWIGGKPLLEASADDLTTMIDQHIWTSFHTTRAFLPLLLRNGWGRVIMIGSPSSAHPAAQGGPYAIGKAGQTALMLTLAAELRVTGVTANLIEVKTIDLKREKLSNPGPENSSWSTPEELSAAILYLLSDEAGAVNGARIPLFGSI